MRRVSRNYEYLGKILSENVTPRMRRVSRNEKGEYIEKWGRGHASHEACE